MREVRTLSLLLLLAGLPVLDANDPEDKNSPFYYDWHRLRVGGLICAAVLCTIGIIVLMSEWEMQMQVQPEAQPPSRGSSTSHHSRLCPELLRTDPLKGHRGPFPSLPSSPGSAQEPGLQDGILPLLLRAPCQGLTLPLDRGVFLFNFYSKNGFCLLILYSKN